MAAKVKMPQLAEEISPRDTVTQLRDQRIANYLATRNDPSLYQSVRNMSQVVSDDYGNRFLVELIQNAHDAHDPSRTDGEIAIVLDPSEGEHGCLYVANRGAGFVRENLKAITNIALSSKSVNAGIGNKGLGFRSVLQICNWPEIYSVQDEGGGGVFDGYCFRFANLDDLRQQLTDEADEVAHEMARNLPCWHIPIPADPGVSVARFAVDGFATVVRLPLKSADALEAVRAQIDSLSGLTAPLHLFLERVERISLDPGTGQVVSLDRSVLQTWTVQPQGRKVDSPIEVVKVRIGHAHFVVAHWSVDDNLFREALEDGIEGGEIPESWSEWESAARVSVAVPLEEALEVGRVYCFLPLGEEGKAPFAGYVNANFYTKMDRRKVDATVRLNALFLRTAAWLSGQLIGFLVASNWTHAASAVVSLLCWDDAYLETLKGAMGDDGQGILSREFLPVRGSNDTIMWASPADTYAWSAPSSACLSPKRICEVGGGRILIETLSVGQRDVLGRLYVRLRNTDFTPPAGVVADWVERIAGHMHKEGVAPERWATLYDEVSVALKEHAPALFGKKFLLSVSGDLISSEPPAAGPGHSRRAADVYFAPVLDVDADVDDDDNNNSLPLERLPSGLRKGFALLSREVPWLKDDGGYRPGRPFLIAGKLARDYDTRDVLRTLAGVTRSGDECAREQALEWAFRLWNSGRSLSEKETRSANFFVPTAAGWIDAEAAMFGAGWDVPNSKELQALLRSTANHSEDLRRSMDRLLPEFSTWPIRHGAQADWKHFLTDAGVMACLRPIGGETVSAKPTGNPANLPAAIAAKVTGLPDALRVYWQAQLARDCARMFDSRQYRAELRPWRIPGQGEHETFPPEVRRAYAIQIALALREFSDEHRFLRAARADTGAEQHHRLATPLYAFVTGAEWVPVARPGGHERFVTPAAAWYFGTGEERPPGFLDFVPRQVATAFAPATLDWLRDRAQLGLFNDERHAGRALLALARAASMRITDIRDVRRFQELFRGLWSTARQQGAPNAGSCVPVLVNGAICAVSRADDEFTLAYFDDDHDGVKKQLLEGVGEPVFNFVHGDTQAAWEWVNASAPGRFRRISDEPIDVYVDGRNLDDSAPRQLLRSIVGSWIVDFLVCAAEHKSGAFVQSTQKSLRRVRRTAMRLTVVIGQNIEIARGGGRVPLPASLHGALALHRTDGPVLIIETAGEPLTLGHLAGAAGPLAAALGSRELAHGLDAALLRLAAALRDQAGEAPDDSMVAEALRVDLDAIRRTRRLTSGDLIGVVYFAIPLSACLGTLETTSRLQALATQDAPHNEELRAALEALAADLGMRWADLEGRMMNLAEVRDLMTEFSLPIARLNAAIAGLGDRYTPISNEDMYRDAWARYLRQCLPAVIERLRERAVGIFDRGEPLSTYVKARDGAEGVSPDPSWFTTYDELPETAMDGHISRWVDEQLQAELAKLALDVTLSESRTSNGATLREFLRKFSPVLSAWVRAPDTTATPEVRQAWINPETTHDACIAQACRAGWLDFRLLNEEEIARWLTIGGMWPAGRAANVDPAAWGLSAESVATSEERTKAERAEQRRRRTQVEFAGMAMSALPDGYTDIVAAVAAETDHAPALEHVPSSDATLKTMGPAKSSGTPGARSGRMPPRWPGGEMSDEQKVAVGLIGELWAREWLRRKHHLESINESVWVSRYRDAVLNTSGGSDSLGYDFIVATKSRTYYYEVKASTGDPLRFELGPTEIFAAQRFRADREHRYRILYFAYVGDPGRLTWKLLPNPFSVKGAGKFCPVGRGSVVYEFGPAQ